MVRIWPDGICDLYYLLYRLLLLDLDSVSGWIISNVLPSVYTTVKHYCWSRWGLEFGL